MNILLKITLYALDLKCSNNISTIWAAQDMLPNF
jgi:hypothetical protein